MANSVSHASLPYPIKNARYTVFAPFLDADGDPIDPGTPDTEISQDGGAYADAAEEVTTITGSNGSGYITITGAETNNSLVGITFKTSASGGKNTLMALYPRNLPILASGTASAGAAGSLTLASSITYDITGCFLRTTGGTGGGGTGGANNQARRITAYNTSTQAATVTPNWETTPDGTTTYDILLPEGVTAQMVKALVPTTAGRTLDVSSTGEAGVDWANVGGATTAVALTNTSIASVTGAVGSVAANGLSASSLATDAVDEIVDAVWDELLSGHTGAGTAGGTLSSVGTKVGFLPSATAGSAGGVFIAGTNAATTVTTAFTSTFTGNLTGSVGSVAANGLSASSLATDAVDEIVDAVWDEVLTGATHNVASSAGRRLRTASGGQLDSGTAQTGGADSITLATSASTTAGLYVGCQIAIDGGTGAGQSRYIVGYTAGRIAYVARHWVTAPDNTSTYVLFADNQVPFIHMGLAQAGGANTITLQSTASATNDIYNGQIIRLLSGAGDDQIRMIEDYDGTTKVATVDPAWTVQPDNTTYYGTLQQGLAWLTHVDAGAKADIRSALGMAAADLDTQLGALPTAAENADAVWDEQTSGHTAGGSTGEALTSGSGAPSAAAIADAVWDEALAGHVAAGTTGLALSAIDTAIEVTGVFLANGSISSAKFLSGAIDANALAADAVAEIADGVWDEATAGHAGAGSTGKALTDALADTNELQSDWTNGGRLDLLLDAVLDDTGTSGVVLSATQMNKVADHVIRRNQATARASSDGDTVNHRSLLGQLSKVNNLIDSASSPGNILVYAEDDTTLFITIPITTDASAEPITIVNPPA
jgi:hypothetical protein